MKSFGVVRTSSQLVDTIYNELLFLIISFPFLYETSQCSVLKVSPRTVVVGDMDCPFTWLVGKSVSQIVIKLLFMFGVYNKSCA